MAGLDAWLTEVAINLCLAKLRSDRARRERTVGARLPEPLVDGDRMLGPAHTYEQHQSVSLAMPTLMKRLSPHEPAVSLQREAFPCSHAEISGILDITEATAVCR